ncbi:MAG: hypothetical protein ACQETB_04010 [Halobacteriota archaeon]
MAPPAGPPEPTPIGVLLSLAVLVALLVLPSILTWVRSVFGSIAAVPWWIEGVSIASIAVVATVGVLGAVLSRIRAHRI